MPPQHPKNSPGYYLRFRGQTTGPYSLQHVRDALAQGSISRLYDVSRDQVKWFPIHTRPAILDNDAFIPEPAQPAAGQPAPKYIQPGQQQQGQPTQQGPAVNLQPGVAPHSDQDNTSEASTEDIIDSILREPRK